LGKFTLNLENLLLFRCCFFEFDHFSLFVSLEGGAAVDDHIAAVVISLRFDRDAVF
jgi:hypothetical protein